MLAIHTGVDGPARAHHRAPRAPASAVRDARARLRGC